jgi:hypothetical protein
MRNKYVFRMVRQKAERSEARLPARGQHTKQKIIKKYRQMSRKGKKNNK